MSQHVLNGKRIAFLATDGFEQVELTQPWDAVKKAGAQVALISLKRGSIQGMRHAEKGDTFLVDKAISEVDATEYDGLVLPGGVMNPDALRVDKKAVEFVRKFSINRSPSQPSATAHGHSSRPESSKAERSRPGPASKPTSRMPVASGSMRRCTSTMASSPAGSRMISRPSARKPSRSSRRASIVANSVRIARRLRRSKRRDIRARILPSSL